MATEMATLVVVGDMVNVATVAIAIETRVTVTVEAMAVARTTVTQLMITHYLPVRLLLLLLPPPPMQMLQPATMSLGRVGLHISKRILTKILMRHMEVMLLLLLNMHRLYT